MKALSIIVSTLALGLVAGCGPSRTAAEYRDDTARVFEAKRTELVACYETALKADPKAAGNVVLSFSWSTTTPGEDGKGISIHPAYRGLDKLTIVSGTAPEALQTCARDAVANVHLEPAGSGEGIATWTLNFEPTGGVTAEPTADAPQS